jgi:hypothetical protein
VILDRPPNDPFLRKKDPFTSSLTLLRIEAGSSSEAGSYPRAIMMKRG